MSLLVERARGRSWASGDSGAAGASGSAGGTTPGVAGVAAGDGEAFHEEVSRPLRRVSRSKLEALSGLTGRKCMVCDWAPLEPGRATSASMATAPATTVLGSL